jgi:hypothetical protein
MRTLSSATITLATLYCLTLVMCGGSSPPPPINWPSVVACSSPAQADLLSTVQHVLLDRTTDPTAELERLAAEHTPDMIACVVDQAVEHFAALASAPTAGSQARTMAVDPSDAAPVPAETSGAEVAATRGRGFLQRVGTTVESESQ